MNHGGMPLSVILGFVCQQSSCVAIMDPDEDIYLTQTVFSCNLNDELSTTYVWELADNILNLSESDLFNAENIRSTVGLFNCGFVDTNLHLQQ